MDKKCILRPVSNSVGRLKATNNEKDESTRAVELQ